MRRVAGVFQCFVISTRIVSAFERCPQCRATFLRNSCGCDTDGRNPGRKIIEIVTHSVAIWIRAVLLEQAFTVSVIVVSDKLFSGFQEVQRSESVNIPSGGAIIILLHRTYMVQEAQEIKYSG